MKLIAPIMALFIFTSASQAAPRCQSTTETIIKDWGMQPAFIDEDKTTYGNPMKHELRGAKFTRKVKVSEKVFQELEKDRSWQAKSENGNPALYGQQAITSTQDEYTSIVRRGYENKDDYNDKSNHYFIVKNDIQINLDKNCKLSSFEILRPTRVKITAKTCAKIRDYQIHDLAKNVDEVREWASQELKLSDAKVVNRIVGNCRKTTGTHRPTLAQLLPDTAKSEQRQPTSASTSSRKAQ